MAFKINVAKDGKTYKVESENEDLIGIAIGETIKGEDVSEDLAGYELEIRGTSDKAGFCGLKRVSGPGLKRVLLSYETGMHKRPKKEGKKARTNKTPKGLRLKKTVRGREISTETVQINTTVSKEGKKKFEELFAPKEESTEETKE
jgi:small subunit ribosomal protein S6e